MEPLLENAPPGRRVQLAKAARFEGPQGSDDSAIVNEIVAARFGTDGEHLEVLARSLPLQVDGWLLPYVVPLLLQVPAVACYRHCSQLLTLFAVRGRKDLLRAMTPLAPVFARLESREGVASILQAIENVSEWWP